MSIEKTARDFDANKQVQADATQKVGLPTWAQIPGVGSPDAEEVGIREAEAETKASVPQDEYVAEQRKPDGGPAVSKDGHSEAEQWLLEAGIFGTNPYHPAITPALHNKIVADDAKREQFLSAVGGVNDFLAGPTKQRQDQAVSGIAAMGGDVMQMLFLVFRESVEESQKDQRYWVERMMEANKLGEGVAGYMHEILQATMDLNGKIQKAGKKKNPEKVQLSLPIEERRFSTDLATARDEAGSLTVPEGTVVKSVRPNRKQLEAMQSSAQTDAEQIKNQSDRVETNFQSTLQRGQQMQSLLATIVKATHDASRRIIANM